MRDNMILQAYRWQRRLGNAGVTLPHAHIVRNPALPEIWDANHVDAVTASEPDEIDAVLAGADEHLAHCDWRVFHTDSTTPDSFIARLALDGFEEQRPVIQMVLDGAVRAEASESLRPVIDDESWDALAALVRTDHLEGARTEGRTFSKALSRAVVDQYRAKGAAYSFHLSYRDGQPVGYGAKAIAPNGTGMIEDLYTLPAHRRTGIASGMIAAFATQLRTQGCPFIFLGAQMGEQPRHLYAKLGFRPRLLTRSWVRHVAA